MRPEILFPLFATVDALKGVGPKVVPLVERVAGPLVRDLLFLPPSDLIERRRAKVEDAREGEVQTFAVTIDAHNRPPPRAEQPYRIRAADETGFIFLSWFKGYGPHLQRQHPLGAARAVSGKVSLFNIERSLIHPDYIVALDKIDDIPRHEAIYPTTAGLPPRTLRKLVAEALLRAQTCLSGRTARGVSGRGGASGAHGVATSARTASGGGSRGFPRRTGAVSPTKSCWRTNWP